MPTLPTDITSSPPNYTPAEHATHHDTAHGILNTLNGTYVALVAAPTGVAATDKATLQTALDSGATELILSGGTYLINAALTGPATPISLVGRMTTIKASGGTFGLLSAGTGFKIEGVTFDGDYPTRSGTGGGLGVSTATDIRVKNCTFKNIAGNAVGLTNVQRAWVTGSYFSNCSHSGVRLNNPGAGNSNSDVWIENNYLTTCQQSTTAGNAAIQSHGTSGIAHRRITVAHNKVINNAVVGIGMDLIDDSIIAENVVVNGTAAGESIAFTGSGNIVTGNNCTAGGTGGAACILLWAVAYRGSDHNIISDNQCTNGGQGVAFVFGEQSATINGLLIRGNHCWANNYGVQSYMAGGVTLGTGTNVVVTGNNLVGNTAGSDNLLTSTGSVTLFNNHVVSGDVRWQASATPADSFFAQGGDPGTASTMRSLQGRHLDDTSGGNPVVLFEGRFNATGGVKAGGLGMRRSGNNVETYLYGYDGSAITESAKARSDGSFEIEGTGLFGGQHLVLGGRHFWLDSSGILRSKASAPASETDGTLGAFRSTKVRRAAVQSITGATLTAITWDTEDWDDDAWYNPGTSTTRVTVGKAGRYRITATCGWASNSTGLRILQIIVNGAFAAEDVRGAQSTSGAHLVHCVTLAANDYIEVKVYQNSGGNLNTGISGSAQTDPSCTVERVG